MGKTRNKPFVYRVYKCVIFYVIYEPDIDIVVSLTIEKVEYLKNIGSLIRK